jgi:hypothetical protein
MLEAALVGANQSSLEQRGDEVDARHDFVSRVGAATDNSGLMLIASRRQSRITAPSVGMNDSPKLHGALDEGKQAVCRDIPDMLKADAAEPPAILLGCYGDDGLALGFSASRARFRAANIGFVNLNSTGQQVPTRPNYRAAQLVQPSPRGLVAAEPQLPLQAERADSVLLAGNEPHRQEPYPQRLAGTLEDRPGRQ